MFHDEIRRNQTSSRRKFGIESKTDDKVAIVSDEKFCEFETTYNPVIDPVDNPIHIVGERQGNIADRDVADAEFGTCLVDAEDEPGDVVRDGLAFGCSVDVEQSDEAVADEHAELSGHEHVTGRVRPFQNEPAGLFRDGGNRARRDFRGRFSTQPCGESLRDGLGNLPVALVDRGRSDVRSVAGLRDGLRFFQTG